MNMEFIEEHKTAVSEHLVECSLQRGSVIAVGVYLSMKFIGEAVEVHSHLAGRWRTRLGSCTPPEMSSARSPKYVVVVLNTTIRVAGGTKNPGVQGISEDSESENAVTGSPAAPNHPWLSRLETRTTKLGDVAVLRFGHILSWLEEWRRTQPASARALIWVVVVIWVLLMWSARSLITGTLVTVTFLVVVLALIALVRSQWRAPSVETTRIVIVKAMDLLGTVLIRDGWMFRAPEIVTVRVNDSDYQILEAECDLAAVIEMLTAEYKVVIRRHAAICDFTGEPLVLIQSTQRQRKGTCSLSYSMHRQQAATAAVQPTRRVHGDNRDAEVEGLAHARTQRTVCHSLELLTAGHWVRLSSGVATVGRSATADIQISLDPRVSRIHATVELFQGQWWITPHGHNGCRINGRTVPTEAPSLLRSGDVLAWGADEDAPVTSIRMTA